MCGMNPSKNQCNHCFMWLLRVPNSRHFVMVEAKSKKWRNEEVQVKRVKKKRISYGRPPSTSRKNSLSILVEVDSLAGRSSDPVCM